MKETATPSILVIDDEEGQSGIKLHLETTGQAIVKTRHPQDVEIDDLLSANLVLVDYHLDNWPERDNLDVLGLKPSDGLALSTVLRRHLHKREGVPPTALALYTGKIDELAAPLPAEYRKHTLAGLNNLEWVFQKAVAGKESQVAEQLVQLASSVLHLATIWPADMSGEPLERLAELLGISSEDPAQEQILQEIEACRPPIHELSQWSHGITVLRWLLHRILPFPCFLWDSHRLAARFRIDHRSLTEVLVEGSPLYEKLEQCRYAGVLPSFLGKRWWRSKIESLLWQETEGNSSVIEAVQTRIRELSGVELAPSNPPDYPIVCVNTSYQPVEDFCSVETAVRIYPDDWPSYADPAWVPLELARSEPQLQSLVAREDKELLG